MQIDLFPDLHPAPPVKPPPKQKPESARAIADRLADLITERCDAIGISPETVIFEMKLREVSKFLSHYSPNDAMAFAVRLIDQIQENHYE
jgi:hypothetical protein